MTDLLKHTSAIDTALQDAMRDFAELLNDEGEVSG